MKIINSLKKSPCAAAVAFSVVTLSLTALYWAVMLFTRSAWINSSFITDHTNTAMDYFNMLAIKNSYASDANYPAICFVFWKIMRRFIPAYDLAGLNDGFDYRENMVAQLGFIITVFLCIVIMAISVKIKIKGSDTANILLTVSLILSGPMLFLLERGNILLIVISLTMLFSRSMIMTINICALFRIFLWLLPRQLKYIPPCSVCCLLSAGGIRTPQFSRLSVLPCLFYPSSRLTDFPLSLKCLRV